MASLTTEAAASSSLSCVPQSSTDHQNHYKYEVFLSFRGEDTRFGFTDHLHNALCQRGIKTFRDDKLTRGEDISQELLKAIEDSRVSIIIFSQTYAASRWSLDELVKILECRKSRGQKVRAVFYKVDPSDVRNQTGTFGCAFATLDQYKYKDSMDKWRAALKEAADLSGWPFKDGKYETEFINEIVVELCEGVVIPSCEWHVATHPIGLQSQEVISRLLLAEKDIVRMVGIWGPGGIGKTTITKDVFNSIRHGFDGACFLADVRSSSVDRKALAKLQETLLYDILRDPKLKVTSVDQGVSFIETRMRHKKVLLVLDDVSDSSQLERLVPYPHCFGPGSRILITTRDKRWLTAHQVDEVYEVKMLNYVQALNLFSLNAFKSNTPPDDYLGLAKRAVRYAQGLPLALTVLGSHLFLRSREEWEATISTMGSWKGGDQQTKIQEVLRLSYDALDPNLKGYFLDIACFFKGRTASSVGPILESCYGLKFSIGIARLQEKALIKIDRHGSIWMHDLIEEMGKDLVFQESPDEPGERSRVWNKDAEDILTDNTGTNKVIGLQVYWKSSTISFNAKSFSRMKKLKYISMRCKWMRNESFSGEIDYLSDQLRWLDWQCPLRCFPSDFHAKKLVYLDISDSREITRLWQGRKNFSSLTHMILKDCTSLTELPDFRGIPNLKELDLTGCMSLVEVPHSLGFNDKLATLTVDHCCNLTKFPRKIHWKFLETISIKNCKLEKFPEVGEKMGSLRSMKLKNICIRELDESIGNLIGLRRLYLDRCQNLTTLPSSIYGLQNLEFLELVRCPNLVRFPTNTNSLNEYGCSLSLPKLWYLKIEGCGLSDCDFLTTLDCCETLEMLNLSGKNFVSLPGLTKFVKLWHASVETELEKGIEEIKRSCVLQHHQYESAAGGTFMGGDLLVNKEGVRIVSNREVKVPAPIQAADNQMNLADLYVVSVIGKGNGGVVQLVQHKWTGQVFALKVIQMNIQESIRKQIAQELKINLGSQCPYIVVCYQSFYDNGCIVCLLEYMDGGSLADLLRKVGSIPEPYISSMCKQILRTLLYLHHENYIIHRDFKPSNLLINHRGEIKITDFGVSTIKTNASERANTFVGTYNYMSPERIQGSSYSYKSDIWSLGLVLLECATGKFPYTPPDQSEGWENLFELMTAVVDLPPPCAPSDQFSPEFCSFISACVQKDPKKRLSAHDLLVHPFVSMYDNLNIDLSSYFTEAGSRLATFEPTPNPGLDMNEPTPNPRLDMNEPTLNPGLDMNLEYSIY